MKIWIDADGCPVVNITIALAKRYGAPVTLVCDTAHEFSCEGAETYVVSKGADSADFALISRLSAGDIVVTQDYGLAAMCLVRQAYVIRQDGLIYTNDNIEGLLQQRYTSKKIRQSGGRLKGPPKREKAADETFTQSLQELLETFSEKSSSTGK